MTASRHLFRKSLLHPPQLKNLPQMLTILLDSRKSEPLYQQICRAIRREIAQGRLQPNEKLPSRRALSAHLQTSLMTVQTAYEQLTAEAISTHGHVPAICRSGCTSAISRAGSAFAHIADSAGACPAKRSD